MFDSLKLSEARLGTNEEKKSTSFLRLYKERVVSVEEEKLYTDS